MGRQTIWGGAGKPPSRDVMAAAAKAARQEMMTRIREKKATESQPKARGPRPQGGGQQASGEEGQDRPPRRDNAGGGNGQGPRADRGEGGGGNGRNRNRRRGGGQGQQARVHNKAPVRTPVNATTVRRARTVVRARNATLKTATEPNASPVPTRTWAACASATRAPAPRRLAASPTRCAPASIPCAPASAAMAVATTRTAAASPVVATAANPTRCAPASATSAEQHPSQNSGLRSAFFLGDAALSDP